MALVVGAIVLFHITLTTSIRFLDSGARQPPGMFDFLSGILRAVDVAPIEERTHLLAELKQIAPSVELSIEESRPARSFSKDEPGYVKALQVRLWPGADVSSAATATKGLTVISVALRKGGYALLMWGEQPLGDIFPPPPPQGAPSDIATPFGPPPAKRPASLLAGLLYGSALFFLLCVSMFIIWALRMIVAPLAKLAKQAERFPGSACQQILIEEGPLEVRNLTRALNRMQVRISSMLEARSQISAAISHDVRTILTRVRMRSEFIDDKSIRAKMLQDLDLMDSMLYKNLQRLRENRLATEYRLVDLNSIIQTVVHHFSDSGHRVNYDGAGRQMIVGSSVDLQRIFNNLIENAVKYAGAAGVVLTEPSADVVQIDVMDEGPGISPRDKQRLIEPYRRGAAAAQGGVGLGLSIAHSLVEQANGQLRLIDREPRGLIVRITLPRGQVDRS